MTTTPNTAALRDLLERVEAGKYDRGDGETKRYSAFYDDIRAAGFVATSVLGLMDALHNEDTDAIRALLTTDTEGR